MEVEAVTVRLDPELVRHVVSLLHALKPPTMTGLEGWEKAFERSVALNQHQFDPPDHPVALTEPDAVCVTTEPAHLSYQSAL
jgi:ABC-type polar amino acid transport system ATPase subunit